MTLRQLNTIVFLLVASLQPLSRSHAEDPKPGVERAFPRGEAAELGVDPAALEKLRKAAEDAQSDAVVIVKDGKLIADWDFGTKRGPIEAMSMTKSIVNLAIGKLIDTGSIKSLDQPVYEYYPEWDQGRKKQITIRHLLNHTSGIQAELKTTEIYPSPDYVQLALAAELSDAPGSTFFYNNKAVNLLAGIVHKASKKRMDLFIAKEIFEPLGITDYQWAQDRSGNPQGMAGLQIRAIDLAKIGQMMLDEGSWKGKQIVSKEWVKKSTEPGQKLEVSCGFLWWLGYEPNTGPEHFTVDDTMIRHFTNKGMTKASEEKLNELKGKPFEGDALWAALRPIIQRDRVLGTKLMELNKDLPPLKPIVEGKFRSFEARGYLGQYLVVMPRERIVAVRQHRARPGEPEPSPASTIPFSDLVAGLVVKEKAKP